MSGKTQEYSLVILRLALGVIFFAHGSQKLLGIPPALAVMAILAEFFGGLMVLLGFFTRAGKLSVDRYIREKAGGGVLEKLLS